MVGLFLRMRNKIIKISLDDILNIMECIRHGPLESGSSIFKAEGHFLVSEGTPRTNESRLMLIFGFDLDLVVARESIHE
jgi:hypothetical protein